MLDYKSICKNINFICNNMNYFDYETVLEFNRTINYYVDRVVYEKFQKQFKSKS